MPSLLPGVCSVYSVMTQRWGDRAKLSGDLPQVVEHTLVNATSSASRLVPPPSTILLLSSPPPSLLTSSSPSPSSSSSSSSSPALSQTSSKRRRSVKDRGKFMNDAFVQVRKLTDKYVLVLLFSVFLIAQPVLGKPWIEPQLHHVTFRSQICLPVSKANLQKLMGASYDEKRMAPDMATAKRMFGVDDSVSEYQGDDPRVASYTGDSTGLVKAEKLLSSDEEAQLEEEKLYTDEGMVEAVEEDMVERRTWLPRRKILNRRVYNGINSSDSSYKHRTYGLAYGELNEEDSASKRKAVTSNAYTYMRRRRRRSVKPTESRHEGRGPYRDYESSDDAVNTDEDYEGEEESNEEDYDNRKKRPKDNKLLLKVLLSEKKDQKKKLKQKIRQKLSKTSSKKSLPWECKMEKTILIMTEGIFPTTVQSGNCAKNGPASKCFYRLFYCVPVPYSVKLLKRDPTKCNPLPSLSNSTIFEERWEIINYQVVVGCSCSNKDDAAKSRRRN